MRHDSSCDISDLSEEGTELFDQNGFRHFFGTQKEIIHRYTICSECTSHLHFTYFTDFQKNLAQEASKCPECGHQGLKLTHRLQ